MDDVTGLELRSKVEDGRLTLSLEEASYGDLGAEEVLVKVEAAPINPSDLGLLIGPADVATLKQAGSGDRPVLHFDIPQERMGGVKARLGQSLPVGNEGGGTVVDAGEAAKHLVGKKVGMLGGAMYAQYRKLKMRDVVPLPEGASAKDGAAMFVNPLTALSFVATMRLEDHKAIIHTAAASNLGQMLQKICLADGIPLVNIVRSEAQEKVLRDIGATHVVNSSASDYRARLTDAIAETGATLAFDAIGGGPQAGDILQAMERAANRNAKEYSRYGSDTFKQVYIYGALNPTPTQLNWLGAGFRWSVNGYLLTPFLQEAPKDVVAGMRKRVVDELTTTFASHYTRTISLAEALDPDTLRAYERKATGEKYLIDPTR